MCMVGWVFKLTFLCLSSVLQKVDSHHDVFETTAFRPVSDSGRSARSEQVYVSNINDQYSESSRLGDHETISGPDYVNNTEDAVQEKEGLAPPTIEVNWDSSESDEVNGRHQKDFASDTSHKVLSDPVDNSNDEHVGSASNYNILNDQVGESSPRDTDDNTNANAVEETLVSDLKHYNEEKVKHVLRGRDNLRSKKQQQHQKQLRNNDLESPIDSSYSTLYNESQIYQYSNNYLPYDYPESKRESLRTFNYPPYSYLSPSYPSRAYIRNNEDYSDTSQGFPIYKYPSLNRKRDGLPTFYPPDYHPPFPHYHYPVTHYQPLYPYYQSPFTDNNYPTYNPNYQHYQHNLKFYKHPGLLQPPNLHYPPYSPPPTPIYPSYYPHYQPQPPQLINYPHYPPHSSYNPQPHFPYHSYRPSSLLHLQFPYLIHLLQRLLHIIQHPHPPYQPPYNPQPTYPPYNPQPIYPPYNPQPTYPPYQPTTTPISPNSPDPPPGSTTEQNPYYSDQFEQESDEESPNGPPKPPYKSLQQPYQPPKQLIEPLQPLQQPTQPPQQLTQPTQPLYQPTQLPYQPIQPLYQPTQPPYQQTQPPYSPYYPSYYQTPQPPYLPYYQTPQPPYYVTQRPDQPQPTQPPSFQTLDPPRDPDDPNGYTPSVELESPEATPALKKPQRKKKLSKPKGRQ